MHLKVVGPDQLLYEGDVFGIKARAVDGSITCLDKHADYLTILQKGQLEIIDNKESSEKHQVTLEDESILFIENNRAVIFS